MSILFLTVLDFANEGRNMILGMSRNVHVMTMMG